MNKCAELTQNFQFAAGKKLHRF